MATIDIGKIAFTQKGTWSSATAYTSKDVVQYTDNGETSSYVAVAGSTNQAPATNGTVNTTYWNIFAKGSSIGSTNQGTWDSATAYNKNDVVQFTQDGTHTFVAVQGSTNQTPQTLGTVNTTYWTKLASGVGSSGNLEVLASVDASSSASLSVDGFFNDTLYGYYKIVYQDIVFSTTAYVNQRAIISTGDLTSDSFMGVSTSYAEEYDSAGFYLTSRRNQSIQQYTQLDNVLQIGRNERSSQSQYQFKRPQTTSDATLSGYTEIFAPQSTSTYRYGNTYLNFSGGSDVHGADVYRGIFGEMRFNCISSNALTGWKIYPHTGNITSGTMTLYGFKK